MLDKIEEDLRNLAKPNARINGSDFLSMTEYIDKEDWRPKF